MVDVEANFERNNENIDAKMRILMQKWTRQIRKTMN